MTDVTIRSKVRQAIRRHGALPTPGERQALRVAAGLSQRQLAEIIGVSVSTVYLWETGQRQPTGDRRSAYVDALAEMGAEA